MIIRNAIKTSVRKDLNKIIHKLCCNFFVKTTNHHPTFIASLDQYGVVGCTSATILRNWVLSRIELRRLSIDSRAQT